MKRALGALTVLLAAMSACSEEPVTDAGGGPSIGLTEGGGGSGGDAPVAFDASKVKAPSQPLPPGVWRVQPVQIMDPNGFERPMVAANALIPAGWTTEGGIAWGLLGQCGADYVYQWKAVAPDGVTGVAFLPTGNWTYAESAMGAMQPVQGGCQVATFTTAREYLEAFIRSQHPDVQIIGYTPRPDHAKPTLEFYKDLPPMQVQGMLEQRNIDSGEIEVTYSLNGQPVSALVGTTVVVTVTQWQDMMNPGRISQQSLLGMATGIYIARAPAGQLDPGLADMISRSIRATPEWGTRTFEFNMNKMKQTSKAMTDRHNINMDTLRAQSAMMNGSYSSQDLASDKTQREFIETVRGVETYYDPVDKQAVQFDHSYKDAWRINDGTYVLTNDQSFDPQKYNLDGVQLNAIQ